MDEYGLKVNISVMKDGDEYPTVHRQEWRNSNRHVLIHSARAWIMRTLKDYTVEDYVNPLDLEKVTAGVTYHEWYHGTNMTIKLRVDRIVV